MDIILISPAVTGPWTGNRTTATRWAELLRELGHRVVVQKDYDDEAGDLMVALHARRSHESIVRFKRRFPNAPLVLALTGTDVYRDIHKDDEARQSLAMASRLVVLQPMAIDQLPGAIRHRARTIYQSVCAEILPVKEASSPNSKSEFQVCVLAHLREVKDPFRAAHAARLLPSNSNIQIVHAGEALTEKMADQARRESDENPRYRWIGSLAPPKAQELLRGSRALMISSLMEGGANVVTEAIGAGIPVISSRIAGSLGLLGACYPGYFEVGDTEGAAQLLARIENDAGFYTELRTHCVALAPLVARDRERDSWQRIVREVSQEEQLGGGDADEVAEVEERFRLQENRTDVACGTFADEVKSGLAERPKRLSCRYFYDALGSQLFEEICSLPEYYVTRAEREILVERAEQLTTGYGGPIDLVELGSGSATKTRLLIEALLRRYGRLRYVPIDISRTALEQSGKALIRDYAKLTVTGIVAEYAAGLEWLQGSHEASRLILWLGSNVGNFHRDEASGFLRKIADTMQPDDRLLVGIDRRKGAAVLEAAYADREGLTARFNMNVLTRINNELGGHFDLSTFEHQAIYVEQEGRVEMHLRSRKEQVVAIDALQMSVAFQAGETVHTENSYKYSDGEIEELARQAGCRIEEHWQDIRGQFSSVLLALR